MDTKGLEPVHQSIKKFAFKPVAFIPLEDRQYGLIRASGDRASTPHPKKWKTNLNMLNTRLEEMKARHRSKDSDEIAKNIIMFKKDFVPTNKLYSTSGKGILNNGPLTPSSTSKKRKQQEKRSTKKVTLLSPWKSEDFAHKKILLPADDNQLSFHERRRIFDEAEFTIAKHGKKMNDMFIGIHVDHPCDDLSELDTFATLQLEKLAAEHGLIQGAMGVLTTNRSLKSATVSLYEVK